MINELEERAVVLKDRVEYDRLMKFLHEAEPIQEKKDEKKDENKQEKINEKKQGENKQEKVDDNKQEKKDEIKQDKKEEIKSETKETKNQDDKAELSSATILKGLSVLSPVGAEDQVRIVALSEGADLKKRNKPPLPQSPRQPANDAEQGKLIKKIAGDVKEKQESRNAANDSEIPKQSQAANDSEISKQTQLANDSEVSGLQPKKTKFGS